VPAEVAFLYDYDSLWALAVQPAFAGNNYQEHLQRYQHAVQRAGVMTDLISPAADLSKYKVVVAPQLFVLPDALARKLVGFVREGGVLVTDLRSAVKDETNVCHERTLPGLLAEACGIKIEEYEALGPQTKPALLAAAELAGSFTAKSYADWVITCGADTLFRYGQKHLEPYAAVTRNRAAKGYAYYVGTIAEEPAFYDGLMGEVLTRAGVKAILRPPAGVEACVRAKKNARYLFLINHKEEPITLDLFIEAKDLFTGKKVASRLTLEGNGVAVLKM
jgi:beta-galactosidase